jgi:hypothetical protein
LSAKIDSSSFYLKNSYENILKYVTSTPWNKNIELFRKEIKSLDNRRNQSAEDVFPELFEELNRA